MNQGITEGGCVPPRWPDIPQPEPPEPERKPSEEDLYAEVAWMTYSHPQLYQMATTKLDISAANKVAAEWAKLGDVLSEISDDLEKVVSVSADGWRGGAADLARETGDKLSTWSAESSVHAMTAGGCVSRHVANAEWARNAMPEPRERQPGPPENFRDEPPQEKQSFEPAREQGPGSGGGGPMADGSTSPMSAGSTAPMSAGGSSPFASNDIGSAEQIVEDPGPERDERQQLHRRAAEVMEQLQHNAAEVYRSVPQFAPPSDEEPEPDPEEPPDDPDRDDDSDRSDGSDDSEDSEDDDSGGGGQDRDDSTTSSSDVPPSAVAGAPAAGAGAGAGGAPTGGGGAAVGGGGAVGGDPSPGARTGTGVPGGAAGSAAGPAAPAASGGGGSAGGMGRGMGMGMMPMGAGMAGAGGAGRDSGQDRQSPDYLTGDSDLFRPDDEPGPTVLGDDPRDDDDKRKSAKDRRAR